jgi:hypothetical protein
MYKLQISTSKGMYGNFRLGTDTSWKYFVMALDASSRKAPQVFPSALICAITVHAEFVIKSRKGSKELDRAPH